MSWLFKKKDDSKHKKKQQEKGPNKKKQQEKGPNKNDTTEPSTLVQATNNNNDDVQIDFPNVFKKSEIDIFRKRFRELCGTNRNYISVGDFLFQLEFNGIGLMKRLVEVVLSLTGKAHAYHYTLSQLEIEKKNYKKKEHNMNGIIFKKADASTTEHGIHKPMFMVEAISSNGILGVHMVTPDSNPVPGDRLYSWASKSKPEHVFFADDFVDKKLDYVLNQISKIKVPIVLSFHHISSSKHKNTPTLPPPLNAMTTQEKSDLKDLGAFETNDVRNNNNNNVKADNNTKQMTNKQDKESIPWDEKEYLYTVKVEKGVFGIAMSKIKGSDRGSVVGAVKEKTQAIKLGIQKGDYIIKLMEFDQSLGTYLHRVCEAKRMVLILHPLF